MATLNERAQAALDEARVAAAGHAVNLEADIGNVDQEYLAQATLAARLDELGTGAGFVCERCADPDTYPAAIFVEDYNTWRHPEVEGADHKWPCAAAPFRDRIAELTEAGNL